MPRYHKPACKKRKQNFLEVKSYVCKVKIYIKITVKFILSYGPLLNFIFGLVILLFSVTPASISRGYPCWGLL